MYYTERLIIARERKGLTQKAMSDKLGIKQQQYLDTKKELTLCLYLTFIIYVKY